MKQRIDLRTATTNFVSGYIEYIEHKEHINKLISVKLKQYSHIPVVYGGIHILQDIYGLK